MGLLFFLPEELIFEDEKEKIKYMKKNFAHKKRQNSIRQKKKTTVN